MLFRSDAGGIVDPEGGRDDLAAGRVRLIREGAFHEDPSRVVRAVRYAARLGFALDGPTEAAARAAAGEASLQSSRVADEARRMLGEDAAPVAVSMAEAIGLDWPDPDGERGHRLAALGPALECPGAPDVSEWAMRLGLGVRQECVATAAVPQWARGVAAEARRGLALAGALPADTAPSQVDALLRDTPAATQVGALVGGADVVARWWRDWRDVRPQIGGSDLVAAGVAPGPAIGRALAAVRAAVLDGQVPDRDAQMALALREAGVTG